MDLSIIIVSYNTKELLNACLRSIRKFGNNGACEIIVVDNASTDGTREWLTQNKSIKLIKNKENLGYARANNQGIKISVGKYILLLNSDTELTENSLTKMIDWMDNNPSVGAATCKLKNLDGSTQATGGFFPTLPRVFLWSTFFDDLPVVSTFGNYHPHAGGILGNYYTYERKLDWITGAFFMLRQDVVRKIGLLDEDFFMYVEELEYCYRIKKAGWEVCYTPTTEVIHVGGASGIRENSILGEFKNLKLFYLKHKTFPELLLLNLFLKLAAFLRIIVFGLVLGRSGALKIYAKALV